MYVNKNGGFGYQRSSPYGYGGGYQGMNQMMGMGMQGGMGGLGANYGGYGGYNQMGGMYGRNNFGYGGGGYGNSYGQMGHPGIRLESRSSIYHPASYSSDARQMRRWDNGQFNQ